MKFSPPLLFPLVAVAAFLPASARAANVFITLDQLDRNLKNGALGTIDLTQGGTALDWLKPVGADLTFAEMDGVNLLTLVTTGTTATPGTYNDDGFRFSWTGGDAAQPTGSDFRGSNFTSTVLNQGFRVTYTAPAPGDFTLKWYGAASETTRWGLSASIGGVTDTESGLANVGTTTGDGAVDEFQWTVSGTADTAGQVLTVDFLKISSTSGGAIAITGVTVIPEPSAAILLAVGAMGCAVSRRRRRSH